MVTQRPLRTGAEMYAAYVPIDRRHAWSTGTKLPERSFGTVLFADISGFTPLTELLVKELGDARGVEELVRQLHRVFTSLITQVHRFGGSVVGFAGDAITCWFRGADIGRSVSCAIALQEEMSKIKSVSFASGLEAPLAIKVALATGHVRRFLVGSLDGQIIDVMAGSTLDRMAAAGDLAESGDIVLTAEMVKTLGNQAVISGWRTGQNDEKFALLGGLVESASPAPWSDLSSTSLDLELTRAWIHPAVYDRLNLGQAGFIAEMRYVAALFLKFGGLDFDNDEAAGRKLNAYIQWVQDVLERFSGSIIQISTGDKGSYLYIAFGAPIAHEDDAERATAAALALRNPPPNLAFIKTVQIGISWGKMIAGSYGSSMRGAYSTMGNETNMAARLMEKAQPGQILASDRFFDANKAGNLNELGSMKLKGRDEPMMVYEVLEAENGQPAIPRYGSQYSLIGRGAERKALDERLTALSQGHNPGAVIVEGEAGIGKSRLVNELLLQAQEMGIRRYFGAGDAIEKTAAYHAWWPIFREIFALDESQGSANAFNLVRQRLYSLDLDLQERTPLLNSVLPYSFPDNDLTRPMEGKVRSDNTLDLLVRVLGAVAQGSPMLLVVEDVHWLDSASWALLHLVQREIRPLFLVVASRLMGRRQSDGAKDVDLSAEYRQLLESEGTKLIRLGRLSKEETSLLISQRFGVVDLPDQLSVLIHKRSEGHPFFSEELAYALCEEGYFNIVDGQVHLTPRLKNMAIMDFPDTLQGIIISRIDRLISQQQLTLKVGSVIGRSFPYCTLHDVYPVTNERPKLPEHLNDLERLDITIRETPEPDLAYIFKHSITQEVVYNLMTFAQRQQLHQSVAHWFEDTYVEELEPHFALLAHHWSQAEVADKAIEFLDKAAEQALNSYANEEALNFIRQAIDLAERGELDEHSGSIMKLVSTEKMARWHYIMGEASYRLGRLEESDNYFRQALELLKQPVPTSALSMALSLMKQLLKQMMTRLKSSRIAQKTEINQEKKATTTLAYDAYTRFSEVAFLTGSTILTVFGVINSLTVAERLGPSPELARAFANMSVAAGLIPIHRLANRYQKLALQDIKQADDPATFADVLWSISVYTAGIGAWEQTENNLAQAIDIFARFGNWPRWGICMEMASRTMYSQGKFTEMRAIAGELLENARRRNDLVQQLWGQVGLVECLLLLDDDLLGASDLIEDTLELALASGELGSTMKTYALLASTRMRRGQWQSGQEMANQALEIIGRMQPTSFGMVMQYELAAEIFLSLLEKALETHETSSSRVIHLQNQAQLAIKAMKGFARIFPIGRPGSHLVQGRYSWLVDKKSKAFNIWRQGLAQAQNLNMSYHQALIHYQIGIHLPDADPNRREHLAQAANLFKNMKLLYNLVQAESALNSSGHFWA